MVPRRNKFLSGSCLIFLLAASLQLACVPQESGSVSAGISQDSLVLIQMIREREKAMKEKNLQLAMDQFDTSATWINSQGYFFEGKETVSEFHQMLAGNDSLDYYYEAGKPRIRVLDPKNAIAYYSWKMFWFRKDQPADTTNFEIGLMTLSARKIEDQWKWVAVTNQHTPWFYEEVTPEYIE